MLGLQAQDHQQEVCADADDVKEEDRGDVAVKHRRGEEKVPGSEDVEEGEVTSDEEGEIKGTYVRTSLFSSLGENTLEGHSCDGIYEPGNTGITFGSVCGFCRI